MQRHQRLAFHAGVDDYHVFVEQGRCGGSPPTGLRTYVGLPKLVANVIKGEDPGLSEKSVDAICISGTRVGGIAVGTDALLFRQLRRYGSAPNDFTGVATQSNQVSLELVQTTARLVGDKVSGVTGQIDVIAKGGRIEPYQISSQNLLRTK